jgi:hypothetical protein
VDEVRLLVLLLKGWTGNEAGLVWLVLVVLLKGCADNDSGLVLMLHYAILHYRYITTFTLFRAHP